MSDENKTIYRITCYLTKGGRGSDTDKVLWSRDMTEAEYETWISSRRDVAEVGAGGHNGVTR